MSAPKVKNLIILILLLVNVFLLILVVPSRTRSAQREDASARQLSQLFASYGIALDAGSIPQGRPLYDRQMTSNPEAAAQAVLALLGEDASAQQQNDLLHFSSPLGEAMLSNGSLTAQVSIPAADPAAFTEDCLTRMGISFGSISVSRVSDEITICRAEATVDGLPVVSNQLFFRYENGSLARVEGLLLTDKDAVSVTGTQRCISAADALVDFLGSRLATGWLGSRIDSVEQGWTLTRGAGGVFSLRPVWRLRTDAGICLVNGITGAVILQ